MCHTVRSVRCPDRAVQCAECACASAFCLCRFRDLTFWYFPLCASASTYASLCASEGPQRIGVSAEGISLRPSPQRDNAFEVDTDHAKQRDVQFRRAGLGGGVQRPTKVVRKQVDTNRLQAGIRGGTRAPGGRGAGQVFVIPCAFTARVLYCAGTVRALCAPQPSTPTLVGVGHFRVPGFSQKSGWVGL